MAAGINIASRTSDSVTLYLSGLDSSWTNGTRMAYWYLGHGNRGMPSETSYFQMDVRELEDGITSGGRVTFDGLEPNTEYGICCLIYYGSELLKETTGWVTTTDEEVGDIEITVPKWSWDKTNGTATDEQTAKAYDALIHNGPTKDFSYKVWNDMVEVVREILSQTGDKWNDDDGEYATPSQTKMSNTESGRTLTATRFNSLLYNIDSRYETELKEVSPGDEVKGSYFLKLANCINDWIDSYK